MVETIENWPMADVIPVMYVLPAEGVVFCYGMFGLLVKLSLCCLKSSWNEVRLNCTCWLLKLKYMAACLLRVIIIIKVSMFIILSSWLQLLREFNWFICWLQTVLDGCYSLIKPTILGCESAFMLLPSTTTITVCYCYLSRKSLILILPCLEGRRLNRPGHCSGKGAQHVHKAACCSGRCDKPHPGLHRGIWSWDLSHCRQACYYYVQQWYHATRLQEIRGVEWNCLLV